MSHHRKPLKRLMSILRSSTGLKAGVNEMTCCADQGSRSYFLLRPAGLQPLQGEAGDFARVFQIEFVFDVRSVRFHGLRAEIQ